MIYTTGDDFAGPGGTVLHAINPDGTKKWGMNAPEPESSPVLGPDCSIYFVTESGGLVASRNSGQPGWINQAVPTGEGFSSSLAVGSDGTLYVRSTDSALYAVRPNGTIQWKFQTGGVVSGPAIGADGTIYFGSTDAKLYAVNPNGTQKWAFQTGGAVESSPALAADGTVYIGSDDGNLYAVINGAQKWVFATGGGHCLTGRRVRRHRLRRIG